jgi:hypothetical protein
MALSEKALEAAAKWGLPVKTEPAAPSGRDRREAERAVAYWEAKIEALGEATISVLDLAQIDDEDWANRFLIAIDEKIERSVLLMYGSRFARLLGLPAKAQTDRPLERQLPRRFAEVFLRGCREIPTQTDPLRLEGEIERDGGRIEQYRAVFIPVKVASGSRTRFAFGAFNSRVVEPAIAA